MDPNFHRFFWVAWHGAHQRLWAWHYDDVIMGAMPSQITSLAIVYSTVYSDKKTSKLRVNGLCAGNSPGTGEFPAQMASKAENVSIWWRHHDGAHQRLWAWELGFYTFTRILNAEYQRTVRQMCCKQARNCDCGVNRCMVCRTSNKLHNLQITKQITIISAMCVVEFVVHQGPLLLTWFNFYPSMDK